MKAGILLSALLALAVGPSWSAPPQAYPEMPETAEVAFVVATVSPGAYLPKFPECELPDRICMDGPPFWFNAKVSQVLSGNVGRSLEVATTSHYGMEAFERMEGAYLLRLHTDGRDVVMPRYAMARLIRARSGEHYLVLEPDRLPPFLPCAITEAREPIDARMFQERLAIPRGDYGYEAAAKDADHYVVTPEGATPRYAIPMRRLQVLLATLSPEQRKSECSPRD